MKTVTLAEHVRAVAGAEATELEAVLARIAGAGRLIARELGRAALVGQLGTTGDTNVQGEQVKKLDVWSNQVIVDALAATGLVCTMVSEEMAEPLHLADRCAGARYVVCFDPVDGSSNLDVNGVVGTIFGIRRRTAGGDHVAVDAIQPGAAQIAAGYVMFGPATVMALTLGKGVDAFTLSAPDGEFVRSHEALRMPPHGHTYSVNDANAAHWVPGVRELLDHLRSGRAGRPYTARYAGSLVADFHRTLVEGGIFLYPAEATSAGKLRLQYEAAPVAFLAEQAGGRATTGREAVAAIRPTSYHQRVALIVGSPDEMTLAHEFLAGRR